MFTRPTQLTDARVLAQLDDRWHVNADSVQYVALGFGSHHWLAHAGDRAWFVTVDDLDAKLRSIDETRDDAFDRLRAALQTARYLRDEGLEFVVAPLPDVDDEVVSRVDDRFAMALYPHVEGRTHEWGEFGSRADRLAVMDILVHVHSVPPDRVDSARECFGLANRDDLMRALDNVGQAWDTGPFAQRAQALLADNAGAIERMLGHYDRLVATALEHPERMVVTHGEPHIGNTIETDRGWVLVDWDTALVAPPERDVWTLAKGDDWMIDAYVSATGRAIIPAVLDLYRLAWDVAEVCIYTAEFRRQHDDTEDARKAITNLGTSIEQARSQTDRT
jgi:hypothetical protein